VASDVRPGLLSSKVRLNFVVFFICSARLVDILLAIPPIFFVPYLSIFSTWSCRSPSLVEILAMEAANSWIYSSTESGFST